MTIVKTSSFKTLEIHKENAWPFFVGGFEDQGIPGYGPRLRNLGPYAIF